MRSFVKNLSLYSITIGGLIFLWNQFAAEKFYVQNIWFAFGFFILVTLLVYLYMINAWKKRPGLFVRDFMAITAIRFFAYLLIMVIYFLLKPVCAVNFAVSFLLLYFLFSTFEIVTLRRHFKG